MEKIKIELDPKEVKLIQAIRELGFGEIKVMVQDGVPIRLEEIKKSIKL